jgi:hypothetical protein
MTLTDTQPPAGYCPGRTEWTDDPEDVFYVDPELRAVYCQTDAPPYPDDLRRLYDGRVEIQRVVRDPKGRYRAAPDIINTGNLALVRPVQVDLVRVDFGDELHVAAWRHILRRDWAQGQLRTVEQIRLQESLRPRCRVCQKVLIPSTQPALRPWSRGKSLCPECAEAVNLAGAQQHLAAHHAAITSWLESLDG